MDERTLALLGDRTAQDRITERGELLPCPFCGGEAEISYDQDGVEDVAGRKWAYTAVCTKCCASYGLCWSEKMACKGWNTRVPLLTVEEMERLEENHEK